MSPRSSMRGGVILAAVLSLASASCTEQATSTAPAPQASRRATPSEASRPLVVFLGDSLTAGLGLGSDEAFPAIVGAALERSATPIRVVNAGVSGDTTAGGVSRLGWLLAQDPDVVVVALGANDGLRGVPVRQIEDHLRALVIRSRASGAAVLLCGMRLPPNYGPEYGKAFAAVYPKLAAELDVPLVPFLLEGVGGRPELNQDDGIHPTARGHERIAANVLPHLASLLRARLETKGATRRVAPFSSTVERGRAQ